MSLNVKLTNYPLVTITKNFKVTINC